MAPIPAPYRRRRHAFRVMRLAEKTLARDIAIPFAAGLAFLFAALFSLHVLQGSNFLVGPTVRPLDFFRVFLYLSPSFVNLGMPVALLLAVLVALGRMAEDREVIALSATGYGPMRLVVVPALFGVIATAVGLVLSLWAEPQGRYGVRLYVNELIKRNVSGDVKGGVFYEDLTDMVVYVERVHQETHAWANTLVHDGRDPAAPLFLLARRGGVDPAGGGLMLRVGLEDGEVHRSTPTGLDYTVVDFDKADVGLYVEYSLLGRNRFASAADEQSLSQLAATAAEVKARGESPAWWDMAFHRRFARPLAALPFSLLGAPVGLARRRASRAVGLAATAAAAAGYYVLGRLGTALAEADRLPAIVAANLGNIVILALAAVLLVRLARAGAR